MASFGENLRRERELRGITLPELSEATKISCRYLRALENNQFERLPGGVFNRGFVRAVARYIKLDEHHWVGEYVRAANESPEIVAHYAPPAAAAVSSRLGLWSFLVLAAAFGVAAYVAHEIRAQRAAEAAQSAASAVVAPSPATVEKATKGSSAELPPAAKPRPASTSLASVAGRPRAAAWASAPLRLQVDVMDTAWLSVQVDGQPSFLGTMHAGESRSFHSNDNIELMTGNASAVILTLNGETLAPLGNPGEVKRITLTAQDLRPRLP